MRTLRTFAAALLLTLAAALPHQAHAQYDLGARLGYDLEFEDLFLGAEARFAFPGLDLPLQLNPAADYFLVDNFTVLQLEVNALYEIGIDNQTFTPYAGGGLGLTYLSYGDEFDDIPGFDGSQTDLGLNVVGGAVFGSGPLRPFAEARIKVGGDWDVFSVLGGVLFRLGE